MLTRIPFFCNTATYSFEQCVVLKKVYRRCI